MRNTAPLVHRKVQLVRLGVLVAAALFLGVFIAPKARMQEGSGQPQLAGRVASSRPVSKESSKPADDDAATAGPQTSAIFAPDAVTAVTYPFTSASAIVLEDMSSGTTQLVASGQDDTASALANIGFEFWFDGVRQTQFSVNANGLMSLGGTVVNNGASGRTNDFATSTNNPKMSGYWDDLCTGATGKVHFKVVGSAPNRKLVVEWLNMVQFNNTTVACGTVALGTFQIWLFENTGVVQLVNGGVGVNDNGNGGYSVGIGSSLTSFASVTTTGPTVSYAASANAQTSAITAGTQYTFTPNVPAAPTGLNFTAVNAVSMTLNWTDVASNEVGYVIYQSTDGVNYTFVTQTAPNATSATVGGLNPSTNYFWQVYAVTEGALSTVLAGSQATTAAGNILSTGAGGNWSSTATWVGGVVPTAGDNVTIVDGSTVTIDVTTATCLNLTVGQGASGILQYIATPAATLTVQADATVAAGGTFTAGAGSLATHVLNLGGSTSGSPFGGNLTVNGTFDMNTTAGVTTNFFGTANNTISGGGATCDFFAIVVNKGSSTTPVTECTRVITMNAPGAAASRLTATNGTFKLSSASVLTPWFGSQTITATTGRLWLNNAGASTTGVGVGTGTGAGSPTFNGVLQVDHGTFGYGSGNNTLTIGAVGTLTIGGADATVNMFGAVVFTAGCTFNMTAGNFNINPQAANALGSTTNVLRFNTVTVNFTGGTLTIVNPHNAASATGKELSISTSNSGLMNFIGSTIKFGDGVSSLAGSTDGFEFDSFVGAQLPALGTVIVDNPVTNAATRFVKVNTALAPLQAFISNLTVTNAGGSAFRLNANLVAMLGNVINNGTIDGTTAGSRLYFLGNGVPQTYSGTGTQVAPLASLDVDNPLGLTIDPAVSQIALLRTNLFRGTITNSNKITLGNGGATAGAVQFGVALGVTPGGNFDQAPVFNLGTGGEVLFYAQESVGRTTSFEINPTRILSTMSVDNTNNVTIAGGDLTLSNTAAALSLANGRLITGANTLALSSGTATVTRTNGFVDGNFRKSYAAVASKSFEVGTANGFSPVTVNVTAGTFPADFTVKAVQGPQPNIHTPTSALQRYWSLTGTGVTADLTFNYLDPADVPPAQAEGTLVITKYNGAFTFPGGTVNTAANTATIAAVSSFSDWTLAAPNAPTAAAAAISGTVTSADGRPLGGVSVNLIGGRGGRTITDASGRYHFDDVEAGGFYTVTPALVNYGFSPASRAFMLQANKTDAAFTAMPTAQTENPLNTGDFFVRQNYLDFLGREPDPLGWRYWTDQIGACGADQNCVMQKRVDVSAAFFMSAEFRSAGGYVYRLYRAGLGRQLTYAEFSDDHQKVVGGADLESLRTTFADEFVRRPEFSAKYQNAVLAETFVDALLQGALADAQVDLSAQRAALIASYNSGSDLNSSRSAVLQAVADRSEFQAAVYSPAFVTMQYFGYLQRDPESDGLRFWINVLNQSDGSNYRGMVCSFMTSREYQERFSPVVTHSNRECSGR